MTPTLQFGWTHHPAASRYVTVLHHIQFFLACLLDESSLSIQYVYLAAFLLWSVFAFAILNFGERNPFVSDASHFQFLSSRKSWASSIKREWYGMNACSWVAVSTLKVCIILYISYQGSIRIYDKRKKFIIIIMNSIERHSQIIL